MFRNVNLLNMNQNTLVPLYALFSFAIITISWYSFLDIALNPCEQFCEAKENDRSIDVVKVVLENGTACNASLSSFDVCIQGKCQVFFETAPLSTTIN